MVLIKIFYLQKDIQEKQNLQNIFISNYFLVDKDFIRRLKEFFYYDKLNDYLNNIQNQLNFDLLLKDEDKIFEIIEKLPQDIKLTYNKLQLDYSNFEIGEKKLLPKQIILNEKTLKYIDNFEI